MGIRFGGCLFDMQKAPESALGKGDEVRG